jgi:hypothetical protein
MEEKIYFKAEGDIHPGGDFDTGLVGTIGKVDGTNTWLYEFRLCDMNWLMHYKSNSKVKPREINNISAEDECKLKERGLVRITEKDYKELVGSREVYLEL